MRGVLIAVPLCLTLLSAAPHANLIQVLLEILFFARPAAAFS
jgi:hypothetical protein